MSLLSYWQKCLLKLWKKHLSKYTLTKHASSFSSYIAPWVAGLLKAAKILQILDFIGSELYIIQYNIMIVLFYY